MSNKKLLNCPFCGGKLVVANDKLAIHPMGDCFLGNTAFHTRDSWIRRWNTRQPLQKIVERLEERQEECYKLFAISFNAEDRGGYDAYSDAIDIVKEEGGLNE